MSAARIPAVRCAQITMAAMYVAVTMASCWAPMASVAQVRAFLYVDVSELKKLSPVRKLFFLNLT